MPTTDYNPDPDFGVNTGGGDAAQRRGAMYPSDPDVQAVTLIDPEDIDGELADVAANLAYWGLLLNHAKAELRQVRSLREIVRAELDAHYRDVIEEDLTPDPKTGKKPRVTDKEVVARTEVDDEFKAAQAEVVDADRRVNDLTTVCEAIRVKADALRSLSANLRAEREALGSAA
jgi:hypothetical protein